MQVCPALRNLPQTMRRAAMHAPCGWDAAARRYVAHYDAIVRTPASRAAAAA